MVEAHKSPNYMAIWGWLFALTVLEIGVIYLPTQKVVIAILLISLATSKAALVAMYFMHLRFERLTLGLIAVVPLAIGALLVFLLIPDSSAIPHRTVEAIKAAVVEKH